MGIVLRALAPSLLLISQDVLVGRNVPEALPLVCLQGQPLEGLHATVYAQPIADEHIHDPLWQEPKER
jgi:hypothetical protein